MSLYFHFCYPFTLWKVLLWKPTHLKSPRDTMVFRSRFHVRILIAISCHISRNASKVQSRNSPSTRYSTISSMFCIRACNRIDSEPDAMNCIGRMSTNGIIGGQKMARIKTFLRHRWSTCLIPTNLTRHTFTEMVQIRSWKRGWWYQLLRTQTSERRKRVSHHR